MNTQNKFESSMFLNKILQEKNYKLNLQINELIEKVNKSESDLNNITKSASWNLTKPFRYLLKIIKTIKSKNNTINNTINQDDINNTYSKNNSKNDLEIINSWKLSNVKLPLISIIVPTYNTNLIWLEEVINSVINQSYENWQLCIADDASTNPKIVELLKKYAEKDSRIQIVIREKMWRMVRK